MSVLLKESFGFLTNELGYSEPVDVPAREDAFIIAFRNTAAERVVEVSGQHGGDRFHCEIRRMVNGEPGSYGEHSISHAELERVREPEAAAVFVYRSFEEAVDHNAALLRRHADLLRGESWIERAEIDAAFDRDFFEEFGFTSDHEWPGWLAEAREVASVLVERLGFELVFDSDTLSPHEIQLWYTLVYQRGETTVEIVLDDFRLDEWFVRLNGETIHTFRPWSRPELFSALAAIERKL